MCSSPALCIGLWLSKGSGGCLLLRGEHKTRASDIAKMSLRGMVYDIGMNYEKMGNGSCLTCGISGTRKHEMEVGQVPQTLSCARAANSD